MIDREVIEVLDWLRRLAANARTVNDGEGEPLALRAEQAQRVIEAFLIDWGIAREETPK